MLTQAEQSEHPPALNAKIYINIYDQALERNTENSQNIIGLTTVA
jgi:hypothetical protein